MTLACQGYGCHQPRKGKDKKGKPPKNNKKYENELAQKEALQVGCLSVCQQKKNNKQNPQGIMMTEEQKNLNVMK
jgi:hypothetical protein